MDDMASCRRLGRPTLLVPEKAELIPITFVSSSRADLSKVTGFAVPGSVSQNVQDHYPLRPGDRSSDQLGRRRELYCTMFQFIALAA